MQGQWESERLHEAAGHHYHSRPTPTPNLEPRRISLSVWEYKLPGNVSDWLCLDQSQCPNAKNIVIGWSGSHGYPMLRRWSSLIGCHSRMLGNRGARRCKEGCDFLEEGR